ncbi:MAG: RHS repeat-associated core domain-containing protein [Sulfuriferula sp.]
MAGYTYQGGKLTPVMFQHDQVMSVVAATQPNGGTQEAFTFWAFGETQSTTGTPVSRLKFTGREDDGTGLYQYRARYYDPTIGRFISEDPKGFAGSGSNWYAYVGNNPINANDPSGFDTQISGSVGGTVAAVILGLGGNISLGISVPDDPKNWRGYQVFGSAQVNGMGGGGGYLGYGYSGNMSTSKGPLKSVFSTDSGWYAEVDAGLGPISFGGSVQGPKGSLPNSGGVSIPRVGEGVGIWVAPLGSYGSASMVSPTLGNIVDGLQNLFSYSQNSSVTTHPFGNTIPAQPTGHVSWEEVTDNPASGAAGGFLLYPNKPNTNQMLGVYAKP